ncbi:hypothetical protein [Gemmata sp. SH-PL17]|nr:hypothetical protein [Gemmata sp. SH-PL17]
MNECSKAVARRLAAPGFAARYFAGDGIDVGSGGTRSPGTRPCSPWSAR